MTFFEQLQLLQRVNKLIARKGTGTPQSLATRLQVPERTLYRLLNDMKNFGFPIQYCKERQSYYYTKATHFGFDLHTLDKEEAQNVEGGTFSDFFQKNSPLPLFGSATMHLCIRLISYEKTTMLAVTLFSSRWT